MNTLIEKSTDIESRNDELRKTLEAIANRRAGLNPTTLLEEAKNPRSTLHEYFTWDNTEAARRWREAQAYELIRRVRVTIESGDQRPVTVRAFYPIKQVENDGTIDSSKRGNFMFITQIMTDEEAKRQVIDAAKSELRAFTVKYSKLAGIFEFQSLFEEIQKLDRAALK